MNGNEQMETTSQTAGATKTYPASPVKSKKRRRTTAELNDLKAACLKVIGEYDERITIRHLFYRLEGLGIIEKTENAYDNLVEHLSNWRKKQEIPFDAFIDGTRWHHGATTHSTAIEALEDSVRSFRKNLWDSQPHYVELWAEKDAILSIIQPIANSWGIPVFPCRGFASLTSLFEAARTFKAMEKRHKMSFILYLGDFDPSGLAIDAAIKEAWANFDMKPPRFERLAVLSQHIEQYALPTRPVKKTDGRAKNWVGGCVEIDTFTPAQIRELVDNRISQLVDPWQWEQTKMIERAEREALAEILNQSHDIIAEAVRGAA